MNFQDILDRKENIQYTIKKVEDFRQNANPQALALWAFIFTFLMILSSFKYVPPFLNAKMFNIGLSFLIGCSFAQTFVKGYYFVRLNYFHKKLEKFMYNTFWNSTYSSQLYKKLFFIEDNQNNKESISNIKYYKDSYQKLFTNRITDKINTFILTRAITQLIQADLDCVNIENNSDYQDLVFFEKNPEQKA